MKHVALGLGLFLIIACTGTTEEQPVTKLETEKDSISYSIGMDIGTSFRTQAVEINQSVFFQGLKDAYAGTETILPANEARKVVIAYQRELRIKQTEMRKKQAEENKTAGEAFLAENANREGVVTLASGLQYKVIRPGDGPTPLATDKVKVHYLGKLIDGTVFDSSYDRGEPATFPVKGVIKGWTEALQLMRVGGKWELYIPYDLAYGTRGKGPTIGPNSMLIFEVELLGIE